MSPLNFFCLTKKILECWISIFSEIQVKFGFFKNMIYGLSLCVFLWPKKQTFLKVLCLESEEERHFGMHQSEFFKYEFIVKTRKTLMIFKSAELTSATVPWHWLIFCLASKLCYKNLPRNFSISLEALKWHWLILASIGALDDDDCFLPFSILEDESLKAIRW